MMMTELMTIILTKILLMKMVVVQCVHDKLHVNK